MMSKYEIVKRLINNEKNLYYLGGRGADPQGRQR